MSVIRRTLLVCLLASLAVPAYAQTPSERIAELRRTARLRFGPVLLWPTLSIDNIGVDRNVRLDPETGDPVSDFTLSMGPSVRGVLPVASRALINFDASAGLVWYPDYPDERSFNPGIGGGGELFLGRFTLFGGASVNRSSDRPSLEIDARSVSRTHSYSGGLGYRVRPRLVLTVSGSRSKVRFADGEAFLGTELQRTLNRENDEIHVKVQQTLTPKTAVHVRANTDRIRFDFAHDRDGDGFRVMPGVTFTPNALISGIAEVGYRKLNVRDPLVPDFSGVVSEVELGYRFLEATHFILGWERDLEYSYQLFRPYYVLNRFSGSVRRQIIGRLDVILRAARYHHAYRDAFQAFGVDPYSETSRMYSADLGLRVTRQARLGLAAVLWDRNSSTVERSYQQTRVGLTLRVGL